MSCFLPSSSPTGFCIKESGERMVLPPACRVPPGTSCTLNLLGHFRSKVTDSLKLTQARKVRRNQSYYANGDPREPIVEGSRVSGKCWQQGLGCTRKPNTSLLLPSSLLLSEHCFCLQLLPSKHDRKLQSTDALNTQAGLEDLFP